MDTAMHGNSIEWTGLTHHDLVRSPDWYWTLGLIALCGAGIAVWLGDLLFAIIIVVAALAIGIHAANPPRELPVTIDETGVHIDHDTYPYDSLRSFWIQEHGLPSPKLHLTTTGLVHTNLAVTIPSVDLADTIRATLQTNIPEEENHTSGTMIADLLGL